MAATSLNRALAQRLCEGAAQLPADHALQSLTVEFLMRAPLCDGTVPSSWVLSTSEWLLKAASRAPRLAADVAGVLARLIGHWTPEDDANMARALASILFEWLCILTLRLLHVPPGSECSRLAQHLASVVHVVPAGAHDGTPAVQLDHFQLAPPEHVCRPSSLPSSPLPNTSAASPSLSPVSGGPPGLPRVCASPATSSDVEAADALFSIAPTLLKPLQPELRRAIAAAILCSLPSGTADDALAPITPAVQACNAMFAAWALPDPAAAARPLQVQASPWLIVLASQWLVQLHMPGAADPLAVLMQGLAVGRASRAPGSAPAQRAGRLADSGFAQYTVRQATAIWMAACSSLWYSASAVTLQGTQAMDVSPAWHAAHQRVSAVLSAVVQQAQLCAQVGVSPALLSRYSNLDELLGDAACKLVPLMSPWLQVGAAASGRAGEGSGLADSQVSGSDLGGALAKYVALVMQLWSLVQLHGYTSGGGLTDAPSTAALMQAMQATVTVLTQRLADSVQYQAAFTTALESLNRSMAAISQRCLAVEPVRSAPVLAMLVHIGARCFRKMLAIAPLAQLMQPLASFIRNVWRLLSLRPVQGSGGHPLIHRCALATAVDHLLPMALLRLLHRVEKASFAEVPVRAHAELVALHRAGVRCAQLAASVSAPSTFMTLLWTTLQALARALWDCSPDVASLYAAYLKNWANALDRMVGSSAQQGLRWAEHYWPPGVLALCTPSAAAQLVSVPHGASAVGPDIALPAGGCSIVWWGKLLAVGDAPSTILQVKLPDGQDVRLVARRAAQSARSPQLLAGTPGIAAKHAELELSCGPARGAAGRVFLLRGSVDILRWYHLSLIMQPLERTASAWSFNLTINGAPCVEGQGAPVAMPSAAAMRVLWGSPDAFSPAASMLLGVTRVFGVALEAEQLLALLALGPDYEGSMQPPALDCQAAPGAALAARLQAELASDTLPQGAAYSAASVAGSRRSDVGQQSAFATAIGRMLLKSCAQAHTQDGELEAHHAAHSIAGCPLLGVTSGVAWHEAAQGTPGSEPLHSQAHPAWSDPVLGLLAGTLLRVEYDPEDEQHAADAGKAIGSLMVPEFRSTMLCNLPFREAPQPLAHGITLHSAGHGSSLGARQAGQPLPRHANAALLCRPGVALLRCSSVHVTWSRTSGPVHIRELVHDLAQAVAALAQRTSSPGTEMSLSALCDAMADFVHVSVAHLVARSPADLPWICCFRLDPQFAAVIERARAVRLRTMARLHLAVNHAALAMAKFGPAGLDWWWPLRHKLHGLVQPCAQQWPILYEQVLHYLVFNQQCMRIALCNGRAAGMGSPEAVLLQLPVQALAKVAAPWMWLPSGATPGAPCVDWAVKLAQATLCAGLEGRISLPFSMWTQAWAWLLRRAHAALFRMLDGDAGSERQSPEQPGLAVLVAALQGLLPAHPGSAGRALAEVLARPMSALEPRFAGSNLPPKFTAAGLPSISGAVQAWLGTLGARESSVSPLSAALLPDARVSHQQGAKEGSRSSTLTSMLCLCAAAASLPAGGQAAELCALLLQHGAPAKLTPVWYSPHVSVSALVHAVDAWAARRSTLLVPLVPDAPKLSGRPRSAAAWTSHSSSVADCDALAGVRSSGTHALLPLSTANAAMAGELASAAWAGVMMACICSLAPPASYAPPQRGALRAAARHAMLRLLMATTQHAQVQPLLSALQLWLELDDTVPPAVLDLQDIACAAAWHAGPEEELPIARLLRAAWRHALACAEAETAQAWWPRIARWTRACPLGQSMVASALPAACLASVERAAAPLCGALSWALGAHVPDDLGSPAGAMLRVPSTEPSFLDELEGQCAAGQLPGMLCCAGVSAASRHMWQACALLHAVLWCAQHGATVSGHGAMHLARALKELCDHALQASARTLLDVPHVQEAAAVLVATRAAAACSALAVALPSAQHRMKVASFAFGLATAARSSAVPTQPWLAEDGSTAPAQPTAASDVFLGTVAAAAATLCVSYAACADDASAETLGAAASAALDMWREHDGAHFVAHFAAPADQLPALPGPLLAETVQSLASSRLPSLLAPLLGDASAGASPEHAQRLLACCWHVRRAASRCDALSDACDAEAAAPGGALQLAPAILAVLYHAHTAAQLFSSCARDDSVQTSQHVLARHAVPTLHALAVRAHGLLRDTALHACQHGPDHAITSWFTSARRHARAVRKGDEEDPWPVDTAMRGVLAGSQSMASPAAAGTSAPAAPADAPPPLLLRATKSVADMSRLPAGKPGSSGSGSQTGRVYRTWNRSPAKARTLPAPVRSDSVPDVAALLVDVVGLRAPDTEASGFFSRLRGSRQTARSRLMSAESLPLDMASPDHSWVLEQSGMLDLPADGGPESAVEASNAALILALGDEIMSPKATPASTPAYAAIPEEGFMLDGGGTQSSDSLPDDRRISEQSPIRQPLFSAAADASFDSYTSPAAPRTVATAAPAPPAALATTRQGETPAQQAALVHDDVFDESSDADTDSASSATWGNWSMSEGGVSSASMHWSPRNSRASGSVVGGMADSEPTAPVAKPRRRSSTRRGRHGVLYSCICEVVRPFHTTLAVVEVRRRSVTLRAPKEHERTVGLSYVLGRNFLDEPEPRAPGAFQAVLQAMADGTACDAPTAEAARHEYKAGFLSDVPPQQIRLHRLLAAERRRFVGQDLALELYISRGSLDASPASMFISFMHQQYRDHFMHHLLRLAPPNLAPYLATEAEVQAAAVKLQGRWTAGRISNLEYILALNRLAGRTFADIAQYPVLPWTLVNFTEPEVDLHDPAQFRDLRYPMGAQTEARRASARERYSLLQEAYAATEAQARAALAAANEQGAGPHAADVVAEIEGLIMTGPPWHWGSHYLHAGHVVHYLVRVEPFTSYHAVLHDGRFDTPDRQFMSMARTYAGCVRSDSDAKELLPEMYLCPEAYLPAPGVRFGKTQAGVEVGGVELPPWAHGDARTLVRVMQAAFESDVVSASLGAWVDLVFGFKQRGPNHPEPVSPAGADAAVEACNIYNQLLYEGPVTRALPALRRARPRLWKLVINTLDSFGQMPSVLFSQAHPSRALRLDLGTLVPMGSRGLGPGSAWDGQAQVGATIANLLLRDWACTGLAQATLVPVQPLALHESQCEALYKAAAQWQAAVTEGKAAPADRFAQVGLQLCSGHPALIAIWHGMPGTGTCNSHGCAGAAHVQGAVLTVVDDKGHVGLAACSAPSAREDLLAPAGVQLRACDVLLSERVPVSSNTARIQRSSQPALLDMAQCSVLGLRHSVSTALGTHLQHTNAVHAREHVASATVKTIRGAFTKSANRQTRGYNARTKVPLPPPAQAKQPTLLQRFAAWRAGGARAVDVQELCLSLPQAMLRAQPLACAAQTCTPDTAVAVPITQPVSIGTCGGLHPASSSAGERTPAAASMPKSPYCAAPVVATGAGYPMVYVGGYGDHSLRVFSLLTGAHVQTVQAHSGPVTAVACAALPRRAAVAGAMCASDQRGRERAASNPQGGSAGAGVRFGKSQTQSELLEMLVQGQLGSRGSMAESASADSGAARGPASGPGSSTSLQLAMKALKSGTPAIAPGWLLNSRASGAEPLAEVLLTGGADGSAYVWSSAAGLLHAPAKLCLRTCGAAITGAALDLLAGRAVIATAAGEVIVHDTGSGACLAAVRVCGKCGPHGQEGCLCHSGGQAVSTPAAACATPDHRPYTPLELVVQAPHPPGASLARGAVHMVRVAPTGHVAIYSRTARRIWTLGPDFKPMRWRKLRTDVWKQHVESVDQGVCVGQGLQLPWTAKDIRWSADGAHLLVAGTHKHVWLVDAATLTVSGILGTLGGVLVSGPPAEESALESGLFTEPAAAAGAALKSAVLRIAPLPANVASVNWACAESQVWCALSDGRVLAMELDLSARLAARMDGRLAAHGF